MAKKSNGRKSNGRGIITYKSYMFRTKDPVIDAVRTKVQDSGKKYQDIHVESGVSAATLHNWFHGNTMRPQFATIAAVTKSLGGKGIEFGSDGKPKVY